MSAVMERDDIEPVANETLDRFLTGTFTVVPFLAVAGGAVLVSDRRRQRMGAASAERIIGTVVPVGDHRSR